MAYEYGHLRNAKRRAENFMADHVLTEKELIPDVTAVPQAIHEDVLIWSVAGMHRERSVYEEQAENADDMVERLRNLSKIKKLDRVIQDMYRLLL